MVDSVNRFPLAAGLPSGASEGVQKAKDFLTKNAAKAVNTIAETTHQAVDVVTKTTEKSKDSLNETAKKSVNVIHETTHHAVDTVTNTAEQANHSLVETIAGASHALEDTIQKAERLNVAASKSVQGAMNSFVQEWVDSMKVWIDSHPVVSWAVQAILWGIDHPILALGIAILLVLILQRLLKALSYLVERALVSILQAPFMFGRFLLSASAGVLGRLRGKETTSELKALSSEVAKNTQKERLVNILTRLEVIRQEQNQLLQEVAAIVASDEPESGDIDGSSQGDQPPKALRLLFQDQSKDVKSVPNHNDAALG